MLHIPLLRGGRPYRSLEARQLLDVRTGEPVAELSQANRGLIAKELAATGAARRALQDLSVRELLEICRRAARLFAEADLPLGVAGETQSPADWMRQLSATCGLPETLCGLNLEKVRSVLDGMDKVLDGLTRGLDLSVLDPGMAMEASQSSRRLSYLPQTEALGAILPSNSPGVHNLWLPALALKVPVALKPGRDEPWTPFRICQALMAAGLPPAALGFYPGDHAGAAEILLRCGRSMLFGDEATVRPWKADSRVQIHGPGWSKVLFGEDQVPQWERHLDLLVASIAENGGRSCLNASGVWLPAVKRGVGRELAEALARRLAAIEALPLDHPQARLAAFPRPQMAHQISGLIDRHLRVPGAVDLTAEIRGRGRVAEVGGCAFLLPTVVWCEDPDHPLANTELLFPFASVVQMPDGSRREEMLARIGPTLVGTALTEDESFQRKLLDCPWIDRLNLGPIPTSRISWDQPHEGNLFAHLYRQRAIQAVPAVVEARA